MSHEAIEGLYVILACGVLAIASIPVIVLVERYLRRRGMVRCVVRDWKLTFEKVGAVDRVVFAFECYLLNERPLPTKLHSVSVTFLRNDGRAVVGRLRGLASGRELGELDLQPWQVARVSAHAAFEGEEGQRISDFRQVELTGRVDDGRIFKWKIAGREDFLASRKKPGSARRVFVAERKRQGSDRKDFAARPKKRGSEQKYYVRSRWRKLTSSRSAPPERR